MRPIRLLSPAVLILFVCLAHAGETRRVPQVRLPFLKTPPAIDGTVEEGEWAGAARMERFCALKPGQTMPLHGGEASFWVGADKEKIYIAVVSETPPGGDILQRVRPAPMGGNANVFPDDSIELFFAPNVRGETGGRMVYQIALNARNGIWDMGWVVGGAGKPFRGEYEVRSGVHGDEWHFEFAVPVKDFGVGPEALEKPFGIRVCRNWRRTEGSTTASEWGAIRDAFKSHETIPLVTWDPAAPVVQVTRLKAPGKDALDLRLTVRNPTGAAVPVRARIVSKPKNSNPKTTEETVTVEPGATKEVVQATSFDPEEPIFTSIEVTSPDGGTVYYLRDFHWTLSRPEPFFVTEKKDADRAGLQFAYYPYHDRIKVKVDAAGLRAREKITGVRLEIVGAPKTRTRMPPLDEAYRTAMVWELPSLKERTEAQVPAIERMGRYTLRVVFEGIQTKPLEREFVRYSFDWERNDLGRSADVIAPFTPLAVEGRRVRSVLREHVLGPLGLWEQATSLGAPLLKAPMRLEVTAGGETRPVGGDLRFTETAPHRVAAESTLASDALAGSVRLQWDYDGMMEWILTLTPSAREIESLRLVIPLDDARMPLFHACTDGIRFNYAGAMPAGTGRVWDGSKAARNSIVGTYVPYIWAGAEERGLAVFGENDRGWVIAEGTPCQELVREGDTLNLVLHLIARPITIEAARTIRIGFLATPVKPMAEDWRRWTGWGYKLTALPGWTNTRTFLGSTITWGAAGYCNEIRPRDGDMRILEQFAHTRRTGKTDMPFIQDWLNGYRLFGETEEEREKYRARYIPQINNGFHNMRGVYQAKQEGRDLRVCAYTNARGVRLDTPAGLSFVDEWHREPFSKREYGYGEGPAYDLDPVESYRDYAMFWYRKMLETGAIDDLYWDDIFLQSNFDTVGTDAYELPDGTIQPASGLLNMRALIRRTAVLMHEMGRARETRNCNVAHMTNTNLAPVLAFAGISFGWEDKNGDSDYQDRWPRDYLRAESLGLQAGNFPLVMCLMQAKTKEKAAWVERTATGVCLTHEIRPTANMDAYIDAAKRLLAFGYGTRETRVWNYWAKDFPVHVDGIEHSSLAVSRPGAAILIVCDYGEGGDAVLDLDTRALGLAATFSATNMETGEAMAVAGSTVKFPLRKHDFRMILVESK